MLHRAAGGHFPLVDGVVEVMPTERHGHEAIVELTGHAVVVTDLPPDDERLVGVDAFGGVGQPAFVLALAGPGGAIGSHDVVLVRRGGADGPALPETGRHEDHPRVVRSRHHRRDVRVLGDDRGLVTIGTGLVGRTELSVELVGNVTGPGTGRSLVLRGLATLSPDEWVFAQVAPGNAASLRMFLACGFVPIGSEILIEPARRRRRMTTTGARHDS